MLTHANRAEPMLAVNDARTEASSSELCPPGWTPRRGLALAQLLALAHQVRGRRVHCGVEQCGLNALCQGYGGASGTSLSFVSVALFALRSHGDGAAGAYLRSQQTAEPIRAQRCLSQRLSANTALLRPTVCCPESRRKTPKGLDVSRIAMETATGIQSMWKEAGSAC